MKSHIKITTVKEQGRVTKYEAYCELCQTVVATRRTEAAILSHIEDGGHPHPETSILVLFRTDELFLENSFLRTCKSKLEVDDPEAKRLFDAAKKQNLIREAKKIGFPEFPGYQIAEPGFLTYRKKVKENLK